MKCINYNDLCQTVEFKGYYYCYMYEQLVEMVGRMAYGTDESEKGGLSDS